jgi:hypothetical protein
VTRAIGILIPCSQSSSDVELPGQCIRRCRSAECSWSSLLTSTLHSPPVFTVLLCLLTPLAVYAFGERRVAGGDAVRRGRVYGSCGCLEEWVAHPTGVHIVHVPGVDVGPIVKGREVGAGGDAAERGTIEGKGGDDWQLTAM